MAQDARQTLQPDTGQYAGLPARHLPPVEYRDLPDPAPLRKMLGPGVIMAGVGLASGEFIIWPYITSQVGLVFLWAAVAGVVTQYFINMEIERYTLATGETALTGFSRIWRHFGLLFAVLVAFANLWPGWIISSATMVTYLTGGSGKVPIALLGLLAIAMSLTLTPFIYKVLERAEFLKVGAVLLFIVVAIFFAISADAWAALPDAVANVGRLPAELSPALVLGALAFAGAGGGQNLVQSNWIRDKGFGMGQYVPHLTSPITGHKEAAPSTGWMMREDETNLARWRGWWKVANSEQLVSFVAITVLTILFMSLLAYSTVFGREGLEDNISFLQVEGEVLKETVGDWFGTLFWVIGAFSLFAAALGIVDYTGRLIADTLKVNYLRNSSMTENKLYFGLVWIMCLIGAAVLLAGFDQPLVLLVISASVGGIMMFIYSMLLIVTNGRYLPRAIRLRGYRLVVMVLTVAFFGFFSVLTVLDQAKKLAGGG